MQGLWADLQGRGLIHQSTDPDLGAKLEAARVTLYCGFDAQRPGLQLGNFLAVLMLKRFQLAGHTPIALLGGGTSLIGDPSGKDAERSLLAVEQVEENVRAVRKRLERWLDFSPKTSNRALLLNNADWLRSLGLIDYLRDTGKHFTVNAMIAKESVRARLEDRSQGISFTEFAYQTLQAYDFLHLNDRHACRLQIGGSDQWGNITAGVELIRRARNAAAWGMTYPLLTDAEGRKLGKTEAGALWLDAAQTPPFEMYQYFIRTDDRDTGKLLRSFTFLPVEEIADLERRHQANPGAREAHARLAHEAVREIHGAAEADGAREATAGVYGQTPVDSLSDGAMAVILRHGPSATVGGTGLTLGKLLVESGLVPSMSEARRTIQQGGVYLNDERQADAMRAVTEKDLSTRHRVLVLRRGKQERRFVRLTL